VNCKKKIKCLQVFHSPPFLFLFLLAFLTFSCLARPLIDITKEESLSKLGTQVPRCYLRKVSTPSK